MSLSASIPATVQIRRANLIGLVATVAVVAAVATWAVTSLAFDATAVRKSAVQTAAPASTGIPPSGFLSGITATPAVVPRGSHTASGPLTLAEAKSIGSYLFGSADSLTPAQRRSVRGYWLGAATAMAPAEVKSIGTYLFGPSVPLNRARLQAVRSYWLVASSGRR
jgi:hypothetical protein